MQVETSAIINDITPIPQSSQNSIRLSRQIHLETDMINDFVRLLQCIVNAHGDGDDSDEICKRLTAFPVIDDARLTFLIRDYRFV